MVLANVMQTVVEWKPIPPQLAGSKKRKKNVY